MIKETFKNTLITGASSGIGKQLAWEFARNGHNLILLARRKDLLSDLRTEIQAQHQVQVVIQSVDISADISEAGRLDSIVQASIAELGSLDTVIANAGFGVWGALEKLSLEDYRRQFEVNVFGVLRIIYATLENLKRTRGRLCLIGSTNSYLALPKNSAYCMSKFAVRALAEALYCEFAPLGISVTLINPGFIKTDIRKTDNKGVFKSERKDPIPDWLMMKATTAACQIYRAIASRKREKALTFHSQLGIWASRFFPNLVAYWMKHHSH